MSHPTHDEDADITPVVPVESRPTSRSGSLREGGSRSQSIQSNPTHAGQADDAPIASDGSPPDSEGGSPAANGSEPPSIHSNSERIPRRFSGSYSGGWRGPPPQSIIMPYESPELIRHYDRPDPATFYDNIHNTESGGVPHRFVEEYGPSFQPAADRQIEDRQIADSQFHATWAFEHTITTQIYYQAICFGLPAVYQRRMSNVFCEAQLIHRRRRTVDQVPAIPSMRNPSPQMPSRLPSPVHSPVSVTERRPYPRSPTLSNSPTREANPRIPSDSSLPPIPSDLSLPPIPGDPSLPPIPINPTGILPALPPRLPSNPSITASIPTRRPSSASPSSGPAPHPGGLESQQIAGSPRVASRPVIHTIPRISSSSSLHLEISSPLSLPAIISNSPIIDPIILPRLPRSPRIPRVPQIPSSLSSPHIPPVFPPIIPAIPSIAPRPASPRAWAASFETLLIIAPLDPRSPHDFSILKAKWGSFIDSLQREWSTCNVISALLLSAILTLLQISPVSAIAVTRYSALFSLFSSLMSLLCGGLYVVWFPGLNQVSDALEIEQFSRANLRSKYWNFAILLSMPAIWLLWAVVSFICCITAYVWTSGTQDDDRPSMGSTMAIFWLRGAASLLLAIGLAYLGLIIRTLLQLGFLGRRDIRRWRGDVELQAQPPLVPVAIPTTNNPSVHTLPEQSPRRPNLRTSESPVKETISPVTSPLSITGGHNLEERFQGSSLSLAERCLEGDEPTSIDLDILRGLRSESPVSMIM